MIRPAETRDASQIAAIQNQVIRDTAITFNPVEKNPAEISKAIEDGLCFLVAEEVSTILGFASYMQFRRGLGYGRTMEHSIVLAPEARGKGLGRTLMAALEDHARAAGVGSMWAGVSGENPAGVAFHARLGYDEIATLPQVGFKFGRWMDLVLMRKSLGDEPDGNE